MLKSIVKERQEINLHACSQEINLHTCERMIFDNSAHILHRERIISSTNGAGKLGKYL